jgi:hypothetical protein
MRKALALVFAVATLAAPKMAAAWEALPVLIGQGYRVVYTDPFLAIEGCQHSKQVLIGRYAFICHDDRYVWHYGKAALLVLDNPGLFQLPAYICVDEERCLAGELVPKGQ